FDGDWPAAFRYRFSANPHPTRPLDSIDVALTAPIFLSHCSQFIVEYAGDFTSQDPTTGALLAEVGDQPDGVTDFIVDPDTGARSIRWYGLPRDARGTGVIRGESAPGRFGSDMLNVVPLRDVLRAGGFERSAFERQVPTGRPDYAAAGAGLQ